MNNSGSKIATEYVVRIQDIGVNKNLQSQDLNSRAIYWTTGLWQCNN